MTEPQLCTIAVSKSGKFLGWVDPGDDIYAAVATYEAQEGEVDEAIEMVKNVYLGDVAPVGSDVLYRWDGGSTPLVAYRR